MDDAKYLAAQAEEYLRHSQSVDLDEFPVELLKLRKCRSFRADLRHKLEIIIRAHGGRNEGGVKRAARACGVHRVTLGDWYAWRQVPASRKRFERVDDVYEEALNTLAAAKCRKRR